MKLFLFIALILSESVFASYATLGNSGSGGGGGGGGGTWGSITGTLSSQSDLQSALDAKDEKLVSLAVSSNITLVENTVHLVNTSSARTLALPTPVSGLHFYIKDVSGLANTNNITVTRAASEQIEGVASSKTLQSNFGAWHFWSDGTNWWIL